MLVLLPSAEAVNNVQASVPAQPQLEQRPEATAERVNIKRLLTVLLVSGVIPLSLLIAVDVLAGWVPLLTLVGLLIFIPLGSFLVIRTALEEFSRIIEDVAPADPDESDAHADEETRRVDGETLHGEPTNGESVQNGQSVNDESSSPLEQS